MHHFPLPSRQRIVFARRDSADLEFSILIRRHVPTQAKQFAPAFSGTSATIAPAAGRSFLSVTVPSTRALAELIRISTERWPSVAGIANPLSSTLSSPRHPSGRNRAKSPAAFHRFPTDSLLPANSRTQASHPALLWRPLHSQHSPRCPSTKPALPKNPSIGHPPPIAAIETHSEPESHVDIIYIRVGDSDQSACGARLPVTKARTKTE